MTTQDTIFPTTPSVLRKKEHYETGAVIIKHKIAEPKACPFCGMKCIRFIDVEGCGIDDDERAEQYAVCCSFNEGGCGAASGYKRTREEAVEAWNKRVKDE